VQHQALQPLLLLPPPLLPPPLLHLPIVSCRNKVSPAGSSMSALSPCSTRLCSRVRPSSGNVLHVAK
jgi:hypothetical protein